MNHKCNSLTATIHALHGAWPEACFYHLKSKMACIDHTDRYIEVVSYTVAQCSLQCLALQEWSMESFV